MSKPTKLEDSAYFRDLQERIEAGNMPTKAEGLSPETSANTERNGSARVYKFDGDDLIEDRNGSIIAKLLPSLHVREYRRLRDAKNATGAIWRGMQAMTSKASWLRDHPSFLFSGPRGTGKTTAMVGVGCMEIRRNRNVIYLPVTRLVRAIKAREGERPTVHDLEDCDLLLIDELHRFSDLPGWIRSEAVALIDHRYAWMKQTGAAGTLPPGPLAEVIGREIVERFTIKIAGDGESFR
jgi:DNA replication protein DnaC